MARGNEVEGIKEAFSELSAWGPGWVVLGLIGVVLVVRLHKIIPACGKLWKTCATTRQKLRHQQQQFDRAMQNRAAPAAKPEKATKKTATAAGRRK
jgi:hypothetical protein